MSTRKDQRKSTAPRDTPEPIDTYHSRTNYSFEELNRLASRFWATRENADRQMLLAAVDDTVYLWYVNEVGSVHIEDFAFALRTEVDRSLPGYTGSLRRLALWNPTRGSFSKWLRARAKDRLIDHWRRVARQTDPEVRGNYDVVIATTASYMPDPLQALLMKEAQESGAADFDVDIEDNDAVDIEEPTLEDIETAEDIAENETPEINDAEDRYDHAPSEKVVLSFLRGADDEIYGEDREAEAFEKSILSSDLSETGEGFGKLTSEFSDSGNDILGSSSDAGSGFNGGSGAGMTKSFGAGASGAGYKGRGRRGGSFNWTASAARAFEVRQPDFLSEAATEAWSKGYRKGLPNLIRCWNPACPGRPKKTPKTKKAAGYLFVPGKNLPEGMGRWCPLCFESKNAERMRLNKALSDKVTIEAAGVFDSDQERKRLEELAAIIAPKKSRRSPFSGSRMTMEAARQTAKHALGFEVEQVAQ